MINFVPPSEVQQLLLGSLVLIGLSIWSFVSRYKTIKLIKKIQAMNEKANPS